MKKLLFILLLCASMSRAQDSLKVMSWNIQNFGKSKNFTEVSYMAHVMERCNIIAIQEVSTGKEGVATVDTLLQVLNSHSAKWKSVVSEPTKGPGSERYAFIYDSTIKIVAVGLADKFDTLFDREPFMMFVKIGKRRVGLVNFHAVPTTKNPCIEAGNLVKIADKYAKYGLVFMGDFNVSQSNPCFNALKFTGYDAALIQTKTSLRMKLGKKGEVFSEEYDNFFYSNYYLRVNQAKVYDFTKSFKTLAEAHKISDHCPILVTIYTK